MGYINFLMNIRLFTLVVIGIAVVVTGCGTVGTADGKPATYEPATTPEISTLEYIPKVKVDKKGIVIPYKVSKNPYLKPKGAINTKFVEAYIQAKRAYNVKKYEQAKVILNDLIESNTRLSGPWVMLGDISMEENELSKAEQHFSKAIVVNKRNVNAYLRLAKVKRIQGDYLKAKSIYADALSLWSDFPEAHLNLGILYDVYLNDDVKAQKHIEAYQFLTGGDNSEVANWLLEIQERTGMAVELNILSQDQLVKPVS